MQSKWRTAMSWNGRLLCLIVSSAVLASCATSPSSRLHAPPQADMNQASTGKGANDAPNIRLYEGRSGSQDNLCVIEILSAPFHEKKDVSDYGCNNDEAKSMKLHDLPPGTTITVYDDP